MRTYDDWQKLILDRAPNVGDVCVLDSDEWEELVKLSRTRRRRKVFGRLVEPKRSVAA